MLFSARGQKGFMMVLYKGLRIAADCDSSIVKGSKRERDKLIKKNLLDISLHCLYAGEIRLNIACS